MKIQLSYFGVCLHLPRGVIGTCRPRPRIAPPHTVSWAKVRPHDFIACFRPPVIHPNFLHGLCGPHCRSNIMQGLEHEEIQHKFSSIGMHYPCMTQDTRKTVLGVTHVSKSNNAAPVTAYLLHTIFNTNTLGKTMGQPIKRMTSNKTKQKSIQCPNEGDRWHTEYLEQRCRTGHMTLAWQGCWQTYALYWCPALQLASSGLDRRRRVRPVWKWIAA